LRIDSKEITNQKTIAKLINSYFSAIAENLKSDNSEHTNIIETNPLDYLLNSFQRAFPKISWKYASTREIEKIIKSLKLKIHVVMMKFPPEY
jgi:hypothetical protein